MPQPPQFEELEVSELFCPRCRRAQPVRKHLLLVLPTGSQYDYRCAVCATSVGGKQDGDASEFQRLSSLGLGRGSHGGPGSGGSRGSRGSSGSR